MDLLQGGAASAGGDLVPKLSEKHAADPDEDVRQGGGVEVTGAAPPFSWLPSSDVPERRILTELNTLAVMCF